MAEDTSTSISLDTDEMQVTQPSLQELATGKALSEILHPDFKDSDFEGLEPRLQRLLFAKLRAEVVRLHGIEQSWSFYKRDCPRADRQLYTWAGRDRLGEDEEDEKLQFQEKWSYTADTQESGRRYTIDWSAWDLAVEDPTSDQSRLVLKKDRKLNFDASFTRTISSQLLYYRITAVFGMMPQSVSDEYKCCWTTDLWWEGGKGRLGLDEHKGAAGAFFHGTEEGSVEALKLLNFLVGDKIPHSYDGILAGTIA